MINKYIGFLYVYQEVNFLDELLSLHINDENEYFVFECNYLHPITEEDADTEVNISLKDIYNMLSSSDLFDDNYLKLTVKEFLINIEHFQDLINDFLADEIYDDPSIW